MKSLTKTLSKFTTIILAAGLITTAGLGTLNAFAEESSSETTAETVDTTIQEAVEVSAPDAMVASSINISDYFAEGSGDGLSVDSPILISTADQLINIGLLKNDMITTYYYFELTTDIYLDKATELPTTSYITQYFHGELYGGDFTIYGATGTSLWFAYGTVNEADFTDIKINESTDAFFSLVMYSGYYYYQDDTRNVVTFTNVTSLGAMSVVNNASSFTGLALGECSFNGCINRADIYISGYAGIFIGGYTGNTYVSFISCMNYGDVYGNKVGFFNGNSFNDGSSFILSDYSDFRDITDDGGYSVAYVVGCSNRGDIKAYTSCSAFASNNGESYNANANENLDGRFTAGDMGIDDNAISSAKATIISETVDEEVVNKVKFDTSTVYTYIVSVYAQTSAYDSEGNPAGSSYVWIDFTLGSDYEVDCIEKIISSDEWDANATTGEYPTYANITSEEKSDNYGGNLYKTYLTDDGNTIIIVNSDSMEDILTETFNRDVTTVNLNSSNPNYTIYAYSDGEVVGTKTFTYSEILAASTSTNE